MNIESSYKAFHMKMSSIYIKMTKNEPVRRGTHFARRLVLTRRIVQCPAHPTLIAEKIRLHVRKKGNIHTCHVQIFLLKWKELVKKRGSPVICENKPQARVSQPVPSPLLSACARSWPGKNWRDFFFLYFCVVVVVFLVRETKLDAIFAVCRKSHSLEILCNWNLAQKVPASLTCRC